MSFQGLLHICLRWAFQTVRNGGFREPDHQLASRYLLQAVLQVAFADSAFCKFEVEVCSRWHNAWPRPQLRSNPVMLVVSPDGSVDYADLRRLADQQCELSLASRALRKVGTGLAGDRMLLLDFLRVLLCAESMFQGLLDDLVWQLGSRVEDQILRALRGASFDFFAAKPVDISGMLDTAHRLNAELARYLESSRVVCQGAQYASVCTDKASVGGFSMQCSLIVLPDGTGVVPPPQVGSVSVEVSVALSGLCPGATLGVIFLFWRGASDNEISLLLFTTRTSFWGGRLEQKR